MLCNRDKVFPLIFVVRKKLSTKLLENKIFSTLATNTNNNRYHRSHSTMGNLTKEDLNAMFDKSNKAMKSSLDEAVNTIRSDLKEVNSRCEKLENRVGKLEDTVKKLLNQLKTVETEAKSMKIHIDTHGDNSIENEQRNQRKISKQFSTNCHPNWVSQIPQPLALFASREKIQQNVPFPSHSPMS